MSVHSGKYPFDLTREVSIRLFSVFCNSHNFWGLPFPATSSLNIPTKRTYLIKHLNSEDQYENADDLIFMVFVFIGLYITMSWGGPLTDLASSGEPRITGIDSIKAAIQSRAGQARRPQYMARARQPQHLPRQASRIKKPSLAQLLSDGQAREKLKKWKKMLM